MSFDQHGASYSRQMNQALAVVGLQHDFFYEAKVEHILRARGRIAEQGPVRVLEVGCGVGLLQRKLRPLLINVWGLDSSLVSLGMNTASEGRLVAGDGLCIPFADESFHLVIAVCMLHHVQIEHRAAVLAEMARVTRRGGLVTVGEHNPWNPLTRLVVGRCGFDRDAVLLTLAETRRRLHEAGLGQIQSRYILFFPWRGAVWRRLERLLGSVPLGGQYFADGSRK